MGLFDKFIDKRVNSKLAPIVFDIQQKAMSFASLNASLSRMTVLGTLKHDIGNSDTLYTILRKRVMKEASIPLMVYKKKDKQALKKYITLTKGSQNPASVQKAMMLQLKALDEMAEDNDLSRLLSRPSFTMGSDAFWQGVFHNYARGEAFIYKNRGGDYLNTSGKIVELQLLERDAVEVVPTEYGGNVVSHYTYNSGKTVVKIAKENIIHWKTYNSEDQLRGFDPLEPLKRRLNHDDALTNASMFAANNNGAVGALMPKQIESFSAEQKTQIEDMVNNVANNTKKSKAVGWLPAPFEYINFSRTSDEMQLLEQLGWTFERCCYALGVPPEIFLSGQTFANKEWAKKNWVSDDVMPVLFSLRDELNRSLVPEFDSSLFINADFSMLPEMQDDMKKLVDGVTPLWDRGIINGDDVREVTGFDPSGDPLHAQYYISNSYSLLSDLTMPSDQPPVKNYGDYNV